MSKPMSSEDKLAQRVVALGVGEKARDGDSYVVYDKTLNQNFWLTADQFINDGRVVLAMIEKVRQTTTTDLYYIFMESLNYMDGGIATGPAIIEACCYALESKTTAQPEMSRSQWWGYLHTNGSIHTKRYLGDPLDLQEAKESPFVKKMIGPFEAESATQAQERVYNKFHWESVAMRDKEPSA